MLGGSYEAVCIRLSAACRTLGNRRPSPRQHLLKSRLISCGLVTLCTCSAADVRLSLKAFPTACPFSTAGPCKSSMEMAELLMERGRRGENEKARPSAPSLASGEQRLATSITLVGFWPSAHCVHTAQNKHRDWFREHHPIGDTKYIQMGKLKDSPLQEL